MIYQNCGKTNKLGPAFVAMAAMQKRVIGWWPINPIMCKSRIKCRFFNISIINGPGPILASTDDDRDVFYA